ncbi:hypothetical protein OG478_12635 [Streptomyces phaeochromogenes]|uniref:hypothetical protein n=1 Tax=Streptomyces phaeochromogenes TaxID=1923 RepID=UPI00386BA01D|nr:hypothetical protein OG478_12635 [Streptomyces phaeochromogenes]
MKIARERLGLSRYNYMRRIAEEKGLDPKTIRESNNNVLRWESGTRPESETQYAIARIHGMSVNSVDQLGWPDFLHLADGDALLTAPWTTTGCVDALRSLRWTTPLRPCLIVTGRALAAFIDRALSAVAIAPTPVRGACHRSLAIEDAIDALANDLDNVWRTGDPLPVLPFARANLHVTIGLLATKNADPAARAQLLLTAIHFAHLCCNTERDLGEDALAEQYGLFAVRAAASTGSRLHTAACLITLAWHHAEIGDPRDAHQLVSAAQRIAPHRAAPRLSAVIQAREAGVHAQLKDTTASRQALDRAAKALADSTADDVTPWGDHIDEEWLSRCTGQVLLKLGEPKRALQYYSPLIDDLPPRTSTQPLLYTAKDLLNVVDAQFALGDIDAAVHGTHRAAALFPQMPAGLVRQYRRRLEPHCKAPAVRDLLELLTDSA